MFSLKLFTFLPLFLMALTSMSQPKPNRLAAGSTAPSFNLPSSAGQAISLESLMGKRVLLIFQRFVGCPMCNLHIHKLMQQADSVKAKGYEIVVVYESSLENLKSYTDGEKIPLTMLADPNGEVYAAYGIGSSFGKIMGGMFFHGDMGHAMKGKKLYKGKYKADGNMNRLVADFIIGPDGKIERAHYGTSGSDHLPLSDL
jgi:peroxiredoxin